MQQDETKPEAEDDAVVEQSGGSERISPPATYDPSKEGLPASSFDEALGTLVADPRRYGTAVLFKFIWGWSRDVSARLSALSKKNEELQAENRELTTKLGELRAENAALKATETERRRHQPLVIFASGLGPVLFFMGLDALSNNRTGTGATLIIAGIVSLLFGIWLGGGIPWETR